MASAVHTTDPTHRSRVLPSFLPYAAIVVVLVAVAALALMQIRGQRSTTYPPHSPQRAISTYLSLLQAGKVDRAYSMTSFDPGPYGVVTLSEYHQQWDNWSTRSHHVTLAGVHQAHGTSSVTVEDSSFSADALGPSEQASRATFTLDLQHGSWRVTGPAFVYLP